MTSRRSSSRGLAFGMGVALGLVPALGPFVACLLLFTQRWRFERRDALWATVAALFGLAGTTTQGVMAGLEGVAAIIGPWLVFRGFSQLNALSFTLRDKTTLAFGLLVGFVVVVAFGLLRAVRAVDFETSITLSQAIAWRGSPALFGHTVIVLGGVIALLAREQRRVAWGALALAALGILVSGSLGAALGWVLLAGLHVARRDAEARQPRRAEALAFVVILLVGGAVAPLAGWGRLGFLVAPAEQDVQARNLFVGTEIPSGDWWDERWVRVDAAPISLAGSDLTAFTVHKEGSAPWLRLQQRVRLKPGETYTLSGWIDTGGDNVPGFQGWGRMADGQRTLILEAAWREDGWSGSMFGPGELKGTEVFAEEGAWRRVSATFRVAPDVRPLTWFVGFTPDARERDGGVGRMAALQLERGADAGPYEPGVARQGLPFDYARGPLWRVAWRAIQERPLVGWGQGAFADVYTDAAPVGEREQIAPGHPHNQVLTTLFERGTLGLLGMTLLLVALFGLAVRYRDLGLLSLALAVLVANTFDATLLSGGVLYPLAAVAGWRSARRGVRRGDGAEGARQLTVRTGLAMADLGAAFMALLVGQRVVGSLVGAPFDLHSSWLYGLLLWPALAWHEGLYPGYGLTAAQELKQQVQAAAYASAAFLVLAVTVPDVPMPAPLPLAVFLAGTLVLTPGARGGVKRLLHAMRLWGRPVVILGAGETGRRVARSLQRTPLDGLHPVGFFDDDEGLRGSRTEALRVRGTLSDVHAFAARHRVRHAIVAIPSLSPQRLDQMVTGSGRTFRQVQFVPKLTSLPSDDVIATDLAGMLALEVRNGLFSVRNRLAKRVTDLIGAVLLTVVTAPVLLGLWIAVRLDSSGGGFHPSRRMGQGSKPFHCLKFRTMHADAEARLQDILAHDPQRRAEYERWHKLQDDPRVTRVGRALRRTSLDELPQLWNVLRGEMSLVGPRPYLEREEHDIGNRGNIILQAKPGITGLWQVSGRSKVTFEERLAMEAHYVRNWSVWWDVILLLRTPLAVLRRDGNAK